MKKFFLLGSVLMVSAMCLNARVYVQTGNAGDPQWDKSVVGDDATIITFEKVADLPKTGEKEIWFAGGTYNFDATFAIEQYDAVLAGGFAGTETSLDERKKVNGDNAWEFVHETILDGNKSIKMLSDNNRRTNFDGLTMQNFYSATNASIVQLRSSGETTPCVRNCKFINNTATNQGGTFQVYNGTITFENCYFEGNTAAQGGALYANNLADYTLIVQNCYFKANSASINNNAGGAVHAQNAGSATILNCVFEGNESTLNNGAALSLANTSTKTLVANNLFINNIAPTIEGEKDGEPTFDYKPVILLTAGNFYYNTVIESTSKALWAKAGNVQNNVFWATTPEKARVSIDAGVNYTNNASVTLGEGWDATNILLATENTGDESGMNYPKFVNPEANDFHLTAGSALISKGIAIATITTDIDGAARKNADLGAYAFDGSTTGMENASKPAVDIQQALKAGEVYTILGQRVSEVQTGNIYIVSGQKMLVR